MQDAVRAVVRQRAQRADPVTVEVIGNALAAIAEEMTVNLARTAHSTIVYEVQDFCTGLLDAEGRLVAQPGAGLPLFVGDLDAAISDGIALFGPDGFAPGDVILTNHTGTCGQHLNNIVVYTPAFFEGRLIGFPATRAHWTDVGGRLAGGFLTDATTSFEEGIQLRSVKVYKQGKPDERPRLRAAERPQRRHVAERFEDVGLPLRIRTPQEGPGPPQPDIGQRKIPETLQGERREAHGRQSANPRPSCPFGSCGAARGRAF